MKRLRIIILLVALIVGFQAGFAETITVGTPADLQAIATAVNAGDDYSGKTIELQSDIDLGDDSWTPIGQYFSNVADKPFNGTFKGNNHRVTGLKVEFVGGAEEQQAGGLFAYVGSSGVVQDLHVSGKVYRQSGASNKCYVGGVAGYCEGQIIRCSSNVDLYTANTSTDAIGQIVGCVNGGQILGCYAPANVNGEVFPLYGENANGATVSGCIYGKSSYGIAAATTPLTGSVISTGGSANYLLDNRTFWTDGDWNTICLPFSLPNGIAGATVMELTTASFADDKLALHFSTVTNLVAGTPYLIKWTNTIPNNIVNPVFLNATIDNTKHDVSLDDGHVQFLGTYNPIAFGSEDKTVLFVGAENTLYHPTGGTLGAFRAYFKLSGEVSAARQISMLFDEDQQTEATGITVLNHETARRHCYNLQGRRVAQPKTGLYIVDGKKMFIK